uniref:DNA-directed RNA polymerase II subunit RPB9-like zinc ribbon domain-containing protein n=4 Tax=Neoaves TaxID=3078114 RepID=A0A8C4UVU3_FALTI
VVRPPYVLPRGRRLRGRGRRTRRPPGSAAGGGGGQAEPPGSRSPAEVLDAPLPRLPQLDVSPQRLLQLQHRGVLHHHHGWGRAGAQGRPVSAAPGPPAPPEPPPAPGLTHGLAVRLADAHGHGLPVLQRHLRADLLRRHLRAARPWPASQGGLSPPPPAAPRPAPGGPGPTCGGRSQSSGSCTSRASAAWKSSSTSACASSSSGSAAIAPPEGEGAAAAAGPAMLLFCPACGNVLVAEEGPRCHRFACTTCPYVRNVTRKVTSRKYPRLKEVDDVLGGAAAWENVDSTAVQAPPLEDYFSLNEDSGQLLNIQMVLTISIRRLQPILKPPCCSKLLLLNAAVD